jgi:hypothetical protein
MLAAVEFVLLLLLCVPISYSIVHELKFVNLPVAAAAREDS